MAKKPISQKRAERQQQENAALQKVLNVFLLGIVAECWLLLVYRSYDMGGVSSMLAWHDVLNVLVYVGLALLAGGVIGTVVKKDCPICRKYLPLVATAGLFLTVSSWVSTRFFPEGTTILCIIVPIITLLGLVFFLYQHECFVSTVALSGAVFAAWVCASGVASYWRVAVIAGAVCSVVVLAVAAVLTRKAQQSGGKLKNIRVFSVDCDYRILYAVFAIGIAAILAALLAPGMVFYVMWVLGIALFALLVYYTTKLM